MKTLLKISAITLVSLFSTLSWAQQDKKSWDQTSVIVIGDPMNETVKIQATEYFSKTLRQGPQQVKMPKFLITDKKSRAVFAIGGFVNFRTAYDINDVVDNIDFVTYDIPMVSTPSNAQRLLMDASTSRLYFKSLIMTGTDKPIEAYIETDFRGPGNSLRLREAYVSWNGLTAGQTVTTFCDLAASFNTIDFEGPNGYTYGRNLMLQYKHGWDNGLSLGIALEYPAVSATTGTKAYIIPQRVPDIPAYVQYAWNKGASHIRASGIIRNMFYRNDVDNVTEDCIGWGAQLSGVFSISKNITAYGQFLYGQGITPYIQDLAGNGLDMIPDMNISGKLQPTVVTSWLVGAQFNLTSKMPLTIGYSQVLLDNKNSAYVPGQYKLSQYIVGNMFYNFNRMLSVGVEYLYGTRYDENDAFGRANRIQAAVQLNF